MMHGAYSRIITFILLLCLSEIALADLRLASWNIRQLGWSNDKDYEAVAEVISRFDLVAIQELMNEEALVHLERRVEEITGEAWSSLASHSIGRGSYREMYAFLWRESEASYVDGAAVFFDSEDVFAREPFSARFRDLEEGDVFVLATIHILYGNSVRDRLPEIHALDDYWGWLGEVYEGSPRVLVGDFNLEPDHEAWRGLLADAKPLITRGATTLSSYNGRYANLYDNIWVERTWRKPSGAGIARFPKWLGLTHKEARARVSDHAPVYVLLGEAKLDQRQVLRVENVAVEHCVDLNKAPATQLERIVHIGPARAEAIIEGRPWRSISELQKIRGIGAGRIKDIQEEGLACQL